MNGTLQHLRYIKEQCVHWKSNVAKRKEVKRPDAVKRSCTRQDKSDWIIADGKHEPIIPESLFEQVQEN